MITEYDTPRPEAPAEYLVHDGSDWMEGTPSRWEGRSTHSAALGGDGRVYFTDDRSMYATLHELDPKTGIVTNLVFPGDHRIWRRRDARNHRGCRRQYLGQQRR